jgi:hypothetical protein
MEEALEKEKEEVRKKFEKEKNDLMMKTEIDQEEKKKLMDQLNLREEA